jgi:hypothetical protein
MALRDIAAGRSAGQTVLYKPQDAWRVRWNMNTDTPLPQDEPAGENPPDGAIIDYYLAADAHGTAYLEIQDKNGNGVAFFKSTDVPLRVPELNIPLYWLRPQQILSGKAGSHRFVWDMHYSPIADEASFSMAAIYGDTPPAYTSPWVMPGTYTAVLTVDGKEYRRQFKVKMDPRVTTSTEDLQLQHDLSMDCYRGREACRAQIAEIKEALRHAAGKKNIAELKERAGKLMGIEGHNENSLQAIDGNFAGLIGVLQSGDVAPTSQCRRAIKDTQKKLRQAEEECRDLIKELAQLMPQENK